MLRKTVCGAGYGLAIAICSITSFPANASALPTEIAVSCAYGTVPVDREAACSKAIEATGQSAEAGTFFYFRALARADQGGDHSGDALTDLTSATQHSPSLWPAWAAIGDLQFSLRHYPEALEAWNHVVALKPDSSVGYFGRSETYERMNRFEESVADITKALELAGDKDKDGELFVTRGVVFEALGRFDQGIADTQELIKKQPKAGHAYYTLGRILVQKGDSQSAEQALTKALEIDPDDQYSSLWLFIAQSRNGKDALSQLRLRDAASKDSIWPGPIIQVILGKIPENQANYTPSTSSDGWSAEDQRAGGQCELNFFLGEKALADGNKGKAAERFKAAIATGIHEFLEYRAAEKELAALGSR